MTDEIDADLAAAFDEMQNAPETDELEIAVKERDEQGRFKAKEAEPEVTIDTPVEPDAPAENTDQGTVTEAEPVIQPLSAPERWSADWKAKFTALPREAQEVLLSRESEYDKGFTQKAQEAADYKRRYEPIEQVLAPRRQGFAMQGMTEEQGLTQLFALSDFAANKPAEFIQWFASQRGIDPATLKQGEAAAPDPLQPVMQKVNYLEQTIKQQQEQETARVINSFAAGHEHFNEVRAEMGVLMQAGIAKDMDDAYARACRSNPVVSEKLQQAQLAKAEADRKAAEAKRVADAAAAAAKAKKSAGTQLSTKASLNGGAPVPTSWDESLSAAYDQMHGTA